jgi:hypothetical protein
MTLLSTEVLADNTLEEFRIEFNRLVTDVAGLSLGNTFDTQIVFEGTTADDFETSISVTDPTADRSIVFPDQSGNVILDSANITLAVNLTAATLAGRKPIKTEFNASGAVTATLTAAESGSTVLIHGTNNNIINLPTAATTNPGLYYDFIVLTAVGGSTSTIVNIAGSGGQFVGALSLAGGTAANAVLDVAGDAFTFVSSTVIGSRARITCLTDDGTDGVWQVESLASPIATID